MIYTSNLLDRHFNNVLRNWVKAAENGSGSEKNDSRQNTAKAWHPAFRTREDEKSYKLEIELPGVEAADISLNVKDELIYIEAVRKEEVIGKDENGEEKVEERVIAEYKDKFLIPEDADKEKIEAAHKNGLFTVTVAKEEKKVFERKIEIAAEK